MPVLSFTVIGEPRAKGRHRTTKSGFTYTPKETIQYENLVKVSFYEQYPDHIPTDKPIKVMINAYYKMPKSFSNKQKELVKLGKLKPLKKPDVDNIAKSILDSLNEIAFIDDKQVVSALITKDYSQQPRVEVTIHIEEE